jgi:hypothetical protein
VRKDFAMTLKVDRPGENEYAPYYAGYIQRVLDSDIGAVLTHQVSTPRALLATLSLEQANFRPGPAEWSIKEVIGHINDAERIFAYRALRISRNDQTPLPGFEQDDYVRAANFDERSLSDLLEEFELLRRANLLAFNCLSKEASERQGMASGYVVSVRALFYIMAGHVEHHLESLHKDYLAKL